MGKFKNGFVKAAREEQEKKKEQERLHSKHRILDANVVIVEKTNMLKFLMQYTAKTVRVFAMIMLFVLATVGLLTMIYPEIRGELIRVLQQIFRDIQHML